MKERASHLLRIPKKMWNECSILAGTSRSSEYIRVVIAQHLQSKQLEKINKSEPVIERSVGHVAGISEDNPEF